MRSNRHLTAAAAALILGLGALTACSPAAETEPEAEASQTPSAAAAPAHWTYEGAEGPDAWGDLSADYGLCETGEQQSPIDISSSSAEQADSLALDVHDIAEHVIDTGHTFQLVAEDATTVDFDGTKYSLLQMHYHDPSEHTIDGSAAPVEFHFVHADENDNLLVVGVMGVEGAENAAFAPFIEAVEAGADAETGVAGTVQIQNMLPANTAHFSYEGSLTTPPCSEGVQWIVMETPIELSAAQIDALEEAYDHNARPVQPLGDRTVTHAAAVSE